MWQAREPPHQYFLAGAKSAFQQNSCVGRIFVSAEMLCRQNCSVGRILGFKYKGVIFQFINLIILKIISFNDDIQSMSFMKLDFVIHIMRFVKLDIG